MIEKPEQYYDTRRHQLYYQWRESEHYIHQEPIYDRTRDYIESLEAQNAKLRKLVQDAWGNGHPDRSCGGCDIRDECHDDTERLRKDGMLRFSRCLFELRIEDRMRELGIEVDE